MMNTLSWATIVIATHRPSDDDPRIVTGFGLLEVMRRDADNWSFSIFSSAVDTLADEPDLLARIADALPNPTFLIGERIERDLFAPLTVGAERCVEPLRSFLAFRLARLRLALPIDLTPFVRQAPLPFAEPVLDPMPLTLAVADGAIADGEAAVAALERHAVCSWLRFLRVPVVPDGPAAVATIATLTWASTRGLVR